MRENNKIYWFYRWKVDPEDTIGSKGLMYSAKPMRNVENNCAVAELVQEVSTIIQSSLKHVHDNNNQYKATANCRFEMKEAESLLSSIFIKITRTSTGCRFQAHILEPL